jgi:hypothetical protein
MRARARETRGQGTADARVELSLQQEGPTTKGTMIADVQLAGRAAAMGRGVIQDVSAKLVSTFAQNLETMLSGGGPAAEPAPAAEPQATGPEAPAAPDAAAAATGAEAGGGPEAALATTPPPPPGNVGAPPPPPPRPPAPAPTQESSLPIGQIVGSVLLGRLKDPKVLGGIGAFAAVVLAVLRRRKR